MSQPTQTPCPHCGGSVYVLATTCVHCKGPLKFNPPAEKGSLEDYRILTGWKQPELPVPLTEEHQKADLVKKIGQLSKSLPLASIQMIQPSSVKGQSEPEINAYPKDFPAPHDACRKWPLEGVRSLWEQSVQYIPDATLRLGDEDGGFVRWLWTQVQKLWGIRQGEGLAIDPYGMWMKALTRQPNSIPNRSAMPVASIPQDATAEEVLRVAEHAKGLARGSIRTKASLVEEESKLCESVSALHRLRTTPPEGLTLQEWQHRIWQGEADVKRYTHAYRQTYLYWLGLEHWHRVVELYERALIKEVAAQRPPLVKLPAPSLDVGVDYEALSLHLDRVAVELENNATTRATKNATPAGQLGKLSSLRAKQEWLGIYKNRKVVKTGEWRGILTRAKATNSCEIEGRRYRFTRSFCEKEGFVCPEFADH